MAFEERIARLEQFKGLLLDWRKQPASQDLRTSINANKAWARRELLEMGCLKRFTIQQPPIVGGLVMRNVDLFDYIFDPPYGESVVPHLVDFIDEAVGKLRDGYVPVEPKAPPAAIAQEMAIEEGYAFIVMAIDPADHALVDVLDAIKEAALRCGITAERIDEVETNERITDRILESICKAQYVIVDVTHPRPNVFYEAGYAQGVGKIPIYIARDGTKLQFDLKDYPTISFRNMKELKDRLEARLRALAARKP